MLKCDYNPDHNMDSHHSGKAKDVLFPDGRKINWQIVCSECLKMRYAWEQNRRVEKFQEAERKRLWHKENSARMETRRYELDMIRIAKLEAELELLRKKYF